MEKSLFTSLLQAKLEGNTHMGSWEKGRETGGLHGIVCLGKEMETAWETLPLVIDTQLTMMEEKSFGILPR